MSRVLLLALTVFLCAKSAYGMDCSLGTKTGILDKYLYTCPLLGQPASLSYCCYNSDAEFYCCDANEFALKTSKELVLPIVITVAIIVSLIVCCFSCVCCSCCPCYRRRHQGTVYGQVQSANVVHVIQTPANPIPPYPTQPPYNSQPPYPVISEGMPQAPPPYVPESYPKQAPYNPNYVQGQ